MHVLVFYTLLNTVSYLYYIDTLKAATCFGIIIIIEAAHQMMLHKTLKVKQAPLQAWTGPEGPRRLRFPDFNTIGT